jgi:hypothetical protein
MSLPVVTGLPVEFATRLEVAAARYSFHEHGPGGVHGVRLPDLLWSQLQQIVRDSDKTNCCTFLACLLVALAEQLGHAPEMTLALWNLAMLNTSDRRGGAQLAVELGLAARVHRVAADLPLQPSSWYAAQGWDKKSGGHSLLLRVLPNGRILTLEARGMKYGGALDGQDGVGSRCCSPRNARDWKHGEMGEIVASFNEMSLLNIWPELYVARLEV